TGAGPDLGTKADDPLAVASRPFQVSNCAEMHFRPALNLRLRGGARGGDYPRRIATYRPRVGDANSKAATVTLSRKTFLAQGHIHAICASVQSAARNCPSGSIYGHATAITPLLGAPLEGP